MPVRVACFLALIVLPVAPSLSSAQNICDLLQIGDAVPPNPYPATTKSSPPDATKLVIQIYSTKPVDSTAPGGKANKCHIAYDLWEVDRMAKDIGFGGYANADDAALFVNARVKSIDDKQDQELVRNVVRQILDPGGVAVEAIEALKSSSFYDERFLNVYYVHPDPELQQNGFDFVSRLTGIHLRNKDGFSDKMIFISDSAKSDTVAHEFAHALSAGHVNFWDHDGTEWCVKFLPEPGSPDNLSNMQCDFARENYMWAASVGDRAQLKDSQKQRMMYNRHSVIYDYSPPPDADMLQCPDFKSDTAANCPRMGL
jgi:hypothetical protein